MKYIFNTSNKPLKDYLFELKEICIIEHEDNWFKEKTHTKLYPNIEDAKAKVAKPHYWILNSIDEYEESDNKEVALFQLGQLVFKSNYYSQKLTSENENLEAKKDLVSSLLSLGLPLDKISEQIISMDTPKYARLEVSKDEALAIISEWS
ncbi:hypothetical protein N9A69_06180 [Gammaproteobacteria bacterium]|nr:hypothetical protein [Gammaproteobacteria bacterium]MDA7845152.1 hypothetical protein [Gammaproteobacteria bacterium]MDA9039765.1 hypothetical protein [Gammaproteobacteria bacterium]MDA9102671.1 hypothetical protein [Gammaproteobacteria bacterium]